MATKEQITAEIDSLNAEELDELYQLIQTFVRAKSPTKKSSSFMSRLKRIEINAPEDFSTNLEQYTNGEKQIE